MDIDRQASELKMQGRYSEALELLLELERMHDAAGKDEIPEKDRVKTLNRISYLAVCCGRLDEAERAARKCVATYNGQNMEQCATYLMMLGCVLAENAKFEEAIAYAEDAVGLFLRTHRTDSFVQYRMADIERMRKKDRGPYLHRG